MGLKAPFAGSPQVIFEADRRLTGLQFTENLHTAILGGGGDGVVDAGAAEVVVDGALAAEPATARPI